MTEETGTQAFEQPADPALSSWQESHMPFLLAAQGLAQRGSDPSVFEDVCDFLLAEGSLYDGVPRDARDLVLDPLDPDLRTRDRLIRASEYRDVLATVLATDAEIRAAAVRLERWHDAVVLRSRQLADQRAERYAGVIENMQERLASANGLPAAVRDSLGQLAQAGADAASGSAMLDMVSHVALEQSYPSLVGQATKRVLRVRRGLWLRQLARAAIIALVAAGFVSIGVTAELATWWTAGLLAVTLWVGERLVQPIARRGLVRLELTALRSAINLQTKAQLSMRVFEAMLSEEAIGYHLEPVIGVRPKAPRAADSPAR